MNVLHRYVSPAVLPLPASVWTQTVPRCPWARQQQPAAAASGRAAARFRDGGDRPAPAPVPLVHVGHLSGRVCFSLFADTR